MNLAKVWNDNHLDFVGSFKGEKVHIPAKSFIEMEYDEAISFKSYPHPMQFDGMGQQKPESFKMIRVEGKRDDGNVTVAYRCHADGSLHASPEALNAYVQAKSFQPSQATDGGLPHLSVKNEVRGPGRPKQLG